MIIALENTSELKFIISLLVFETTKQAIAIRLLSIGIFRLFRDAIFTPRKKGK